MVSCCHSDTELKLLHLILFFELPVNTQTQTTVLSKHTEQTGRAVVRTREWVLFTLLKAQRAGQRAGPFLSTCGDECLSVETNGTRNINSIYLFLLYPCRDLSCLFRLARMAVFAPLLSLALLVTTVHLI